MNKITMIYPATSDGRQLMAGAKELSGAESWDRCTTPTSEEHSADIRLTINN